MKRLSTTTLHNLGFVLVLLLIATIAWQGKRTQDALLETNDEIIDHLELITVGQGVLSSLQDIETGMRGYVLTGEPEYLAPYDTGREKLLRQRARLGEILLARSPAWSPWLAQLDRHIGARIGSAALNVANRDRAGPFRDRAGVGKRAMDRLRDMLGRLEAEERRHLREESAAVRHQVERGRLLAWGGALVILLVSLGTLLLINRNLRARHEAAQRAEAGEARLAKQQAFLRQVVDSDENLIFVCDSIGRIDLCNIAFADFVGRSPAEIEGRSPTELGIHEALAPLLDGDEAMLASRKELRRGEVPVTGPDGVIRWFQLIKRLLETADGRRQQVVTVAVDVSVRHQIAQMKTEFISTVSHELRTPLTAIRGALSMLSDGTAGAIPGEARPLLDIALRNSERLVRLINDILDIEKLDAGRIELQLGQMQLGPLVDLALEQIGPYAREYGITVRRMDGDDATVQTDPDRFAQVMDNLLSNAIKHSPAGGEVRVGVQRQGDSVEVSVSDDGAGIPESFRQRVFERFAQADSSDARRRGGTGLGLAITRSLVERFGGQIGFITADGTGTRFHVRLPVIAADGEHDDPAGDIDAATESGANARVLVFERREDCAQGLVAQLRQHGYDCVVADSAALAWRVLEEQHIDALVLAVGGEGEGGLGFLRVLRDRKGFRHLPVVVASLTASGDAADIEGGALGVVDWLRKPMQPERVVEAVRSVLGRDRQVPSVLHVEDDPDLRALLAKLLQGDRLHLYPAASLAEARAQLTRRHYSLVILDLGLPDGDGSDLLAELSNARPPTYVIIFSARDTPTHDNDIVLRHLVKSRHRAAELAMLVSRYLTEWPQARNGGTA
jgi:PAS domain S-box-containing protein